MTRLLTMLALLAGLLWCAPPSFAQAESWRQFREDGDRLLAERKYREAEESYVLALKAAERFGLDDPRVAGCLNSLALLYYAQHRYELAEMLYWRAARILEAALGPHHPELATLLENLAEL